MVVNLRPVSTSQTLTHHSWLPETAVRPSREKSTTDTSEVWRYTERPAPLAAADQLAGVAIPASVLERDVLPARVREQYGFSWDPLRAVALHGGAEYVKRVVVPVLPERVRMLPLARAA